MGQGGAGVKTSCRGGVTVQLGHSWGEEGQRGGAVLKIFGARAGQDGACIPVENSKEQQLVKILSHY